MSKESESFYHFQLHDFAQDENSPFLNTSYQNGLDSKNQDSSSEDLVEYVPESLQYEPDESQVYHHHNLQRRFEEEGVFWTFGRKRALKRWILTFVIGVLTGVVGYLATLLSQTMCDLKFSITNSMISYEKKHEVPYGTGLVVFVAFNLLFASIAWYMVEIEGMAGGSGIPEIKV